MTQEVLKLALEALEYMSMTAERYVDNRIPEAAITAIKEALAQEQEPVKIVQYNCTCGRTMKFESVHGVVAPQRTWVGLTDEELERLIHNFGSDPHTLLDEVDARLRSRNT